MAIEHDSIADGERHEPKGVSTAPANSIYVADGAGSGSWTATEGIITVNGSNEGELPHSDGAGSYNWERIQGWEQYQDSRTTSGTPTLTLSPSTRTKLVCDGNVTINSQSPSDALVPMWDTTDNKIVPISEFDLYELRVQFSAENYGGTSPYLDLDLDIGGGIGQIVWRNISLNKSGAVVKTSAAFPVYAGSTFFANGGEFYLTYTGTGTCAIHTVSVLVVRMMKGY